MSPPQSTLWHQDVAHLVHPYSNLDAHTTRGPTVITRGDGCYVYDEHGRRFLEGMSGLWCASLGFSEKRLVQAATAQLDTLPYYHLFNHRSHPPGIALAQALTGRSDLQGTAEYFLERGVGCCIFTLGPDGAYYHDSQGVRFRVPAFQVDVRCTCGCGDAFNAGFAVALRRGLDAEQAVRVAPATAAHNASGLGSQAGVVDFEDTWSFMQRTATRPHGLALA